MTEYKQITANQVSMFSIVCLLISIIKCIHSYPPYVQIGHYPHLISKGVNNRDCGFKYKTTRKTITFGLNCYQNKYPNYTYIDSGGYVLTDPQSHVVQTQSQVTQRVYRGRDTGLMESSWTVLIRIWRNYRRTDSSCTGVLVGWQWVLTAAHCYRIGTEFQRTIVIQAGSTLRSYRAGVNQKILVKIDGSNWFTHPNFSHDAPNDDFKSAIHDFGLIKLPERFGTSNEGMEGWVNPICLPEWKPNATHERLDSASAFGFGYHRNPPDLSYPDRLQRADFTVDNSIHCFNMLCARTVGDVVALCQGDSGAGWVQYLDQHETRALLIGIYRGAAPSVTCGRQVDSIYANQVARVMDWVNQTIHEH